MLLVFTKVGASVLVIVNMNNSVWLQYLCMFECGVEAILCMYSGCVLEQIEACRLFIWIEDLNNEDHIFLAVHLELSSNWVTTLPYKVTFISACLQCIRAYANKI